MVSESQLELILLLSLPTWKEKEREGEREKDRPLVVRQSRNYSLGDATVSKRRSNSIRTE